MHGRRWPKFVNMSNNNKKQRRQQQQRLGTNGRRIFTGTTPPHLLLPLQEDPKEPNTWFLRPTRVHNPTGISISFSVFAGFIVEPNRQTHTERQTTLCTCSNRPHRCTLSMRCGLIIAQKVPNYNTNWCRSYPAFNVLAVKFHVDLKVLKNRLSKHRLTVIAYTVIALWKFNLSLSACISFKSVFTARCYASAVLAMSLCPSVSVCVCVRVRVCHKPVFY